MTIYITPDGRFVFNEVFSDEGDMVLPGGAFLDDLERLIPIKTYLISSGLYSKAVINDKINYNIEIECTNNLDPGEPIDINIPIPAGFTLLDYYSEEGEYDSQLATWSPILNSDKKAKLNLTLLAVTPGTWAQTITIESDNTVLSKSCVISSSDADGAINTATALISDSVTLNNLKHDEVYTIGVSQKISDSGIVGIYDGIKDYHLSVINGSEIIGSRPIYQGNYERNEVTFRYNSGEPLSLRFYGQYHSISTAVIQRAGGITLKKGLDSSYESKANLLANPDRLMADGLTTSIVIPGAATSAEYLYTLNPLSPLTGENPFYIGLILNLDCDNAESTGVQVQILSSSGAESEIMSTTLEEGANIVTFGDEYNLWGLSSKDIEGHEITVKIKLSNTSLTEITSEFKNLAASLYWREDETFGREGFTCENEHSRVRQLFLTELELPEGADTEIETIKLSKTDGVRITNISVNLKTIVINFLVWGDTLEEAENKLEAISEWMVNDVNIMDEPIPKKYVFDNKPNREYEAVLVGQIEKEIEYSTLKCKATLKIPSGVALGPVRTTGAVDTVKGKIKVRPVVTIMATGANEIIVTENVNNQKVGIDLALPAGVQLIIDSKNRTVTDSEGTEYTQLKLDTTWFKLFRQYNFTVQGAVFQTAQYREGY